MGNQDAAVDIIISEDKMSCSLSVTPPIGNGKGLNIGDLQMYLQNAGIKFGIDEDKLTRVLEICNLDRNPVSDMVVARGKAAEKEVPSYIKLKKRLFERTSPSEHHAKIDYREVSPYTFVKRGEPLGKDIDSKPGVEGVNVFDERTAFTKKDIENFTSGENIVHRDGVYYAGMSGRFILENKEFSISNNLEIDGDVDYSTGHISFAGNVFIKGEIKDGFKVVCGGELHCKMTMDASEVACKKDLKVGGGIIGRTKRATVRAGGQIITKFVQNCHIESQSGVVIASGIVDSELYTLNRLIMDEKKGTIVGSKVFAESGIELFDLGREGSHGSAITCGISYIVSRKHESVQTRMNYISTKLMKLKTLEQTARNLELQQQAEKAISKMQVAISGYLAEQFSDFDAEVIVHGTAHIGTVIRICDLTYTVTNPISKSIFKYNDERKEIEIIPIKD